MKKVLRIFKENKQFTLFFILGLVVIGVAIFAPQLSPYDPLDAVMTESLQEPSSAHPFGTDKLGRDLLSRVIFGTRTSLIMTLCLVAVIFVIGTFLGVIAGYFGGIVDAVIMRIADMMFCFPGPCAGHRHCRYAGTEPCQCRYLHRGCKLDEICPSCKKYGSESQEESLHRGSCGKRNKDLEDSSCTCSSKHGNTDGGNCGSRYRNHDAGAGFPFFPGIWCNCADTGVGTDAQRGKNLHGKSAMAYDLPWYCHCDLRGCFQHAWRQHPRRTGSTPGLIKHFL